MAGGSFASAVRAPDVKENTSFLDEFRSQGAAARFRNLYGACFLDVFQLWPAVPAVEHACKVFDGACFLEVFRFKMKSRAGAGSRRKLENAKNIEKTMSIVISECNLSADASAKKTQTQKTSRKQRPS